LDVNICYVKNNTDNFKLRELNEKMGMDFVAIEIIRYILLFKEESNEIY